MVVLIKTFISGTILRHASKWNYEKLIFQRLLTTATSAAGFDDYGHECNTFHIDVPEKFNFTRDVIDQWAEKEKKGLARKYPALWFMEISGREHKWSFQELSRQAKRGANVLQKDIGLSPGERAIVILPKMPEWWMLNLACIRAGIVICPGTTMLTSHDIEHRLQTSGAATIITSTDIAPTVDEVRQHCPSLKNKIIVAKENVNRDGWIDFKHLYDHAPENHQCVDTLSSDIMSIFFTSGTTGHPKMTAHTQASYGLGHTGTARHWLDLTETDVIWALSDTGWAKSAYSNLFAPWIAGSSVFIHESPKFDPLETLTVLMNYPISVFCGPPTAYRMMVRHPSLPLLKESSMRHFVSAGEPLNPEVINQWKDKTGYLIREGYGQTETTLLCGTFRCMEHRPGSMGKPAPGFDIRIVDNDGNEVPPYAEGDIAVRVKPKRPVGLYAGYVDEPERTAHTYRGDFYFTGDRAYRDDDGYIWFVSRSDDVILSSGYRIGPFEVESALIQHAAVAESAVVSTPDPVRGEVVKAYIVLSDSYRDYTDKEKLISEIQEHVKSVTAPYKYPRKVQFVEQLPKTISGKIRRVELRDHEWGRTTEVTMEDMSAENK